VEDSEAVLSVTMGGVVSEFTQLGVFRADVRVVIGTNTGLLHVEPVAVSICSSNGVVDENVVSSCEPPGAWGLISIQKTV